MFYNSKKKTFYWVFKAILEKALWLLGLNDYVVCFWHRVQRNSKLGNKIELVTGKVLRTLFIHTTEQALNATLVSSFSLSLPNKFLVIIGCYAIYVSVCHTLEWNKNQPNAINKTSRCLFAPLRRPANLFLLVFLLNPYKYWLVFHGHLRDFYMVFEMLSSHIAFILFFFIDFSP